jgi:hypothetical protein
MIIQTIFLAMPGCEFQNSKVTSQRLQVTSSEKGLPTLPGPFPIDHPSPAG